VRFQRETLWIYVSIKRTVASGIPADFPAAVHNKLRLLNSPVGITGQIKDKMVPGLSLTNHSMYTRTHRLTVAHWAGKLLNSGKNGDGVAKAYPPLSYGYIADRRDRETVDSVHLRATVKWQQVAARLIIRIAVPRYWQPVRRFALKDPQNILARCGHFVLLHLVLA
jgi:hypothetical protein